MNMHDPYWRPRPIIYRCAEAGCPVVEKRRVAATPENWPYCPKHGRRLANPRESRKL
jgi:hypothetical protein